MKTVTQKMIDFDLTDKCLNINLKINLVNIMEQNNQQYQDFATMKQEDIINDLIDENFTLPISVIDLPI